MVSKQKLIDFMTKQTLLSRQDASEGIDAFTEAVTYYLSKGETVNLLNFGTFGVRKWKARLSHNIHSREKILLEERTIPTFKVSKALKYKTNEKVESI